MLQLIFEDTKQINSLKITLNGEEKTIVLTDSIKSDNPVIIYFDKKGCNKLVQDIMDASTGEENTTRVESSIVKNNSNEELAISVLKRIDQMLTKSEVVEDELSEVSKWRIEVVIFLKKLHPKMRIRSCELWNIDDEMKSRARAFLFEKIGGTINAESMCKEVFRKPKKSIRRDDFQEYRIGSYDET